MTYPQEASRELGSQPPRSQMTILFECGAQMLLIYIYILLFWHLLLLFFKFHFLFYFIFQFLFYFIFFGPKNIFLHFNNTKLTLVNYLLSFRILITTKCHGHYNWSSKILYRWMDYRYEIYWWLLCFKFQESICIYKSNCKEWVTRFFFIALYLLKKIISYVQFQLKQKFMLH